MTARRRVAVAGVFDIANYGDLLFPLIAAYRLAPHGIEAIAVAPRAVPPVLTDALPTQSLDWLVADATPLDGVLIGGGNIIYNLRTDYLRVLDGALPDWLRDGLHTGLWLAATQAAALRDIPVAWNAPGVAYPFSGTTVDAVLRPALAATDHVAVRDTASVARLGGVAAQVVPDTAIDLARMWPRPSLAPDLHRLRARIGLDGAAYWVAHLRAAPSDAAALDAAAAGIARIAGQTGLLPVLLCIGDALGDGATARALSARLGVPHARLDEPTGLREVTALLAHARLYAGGSLHGYVAATAYGVPGLIVTRAAYHKFGGFLRWIGRPQDLLRGWEAAAERAAVRLEEPAGIPIEVDAAADAHWAAVRAMLDDPERLRAERAALLRGLAARGARVAGAGWALAPWTRPGVAA